jgi:hypothetical protein
MKIAPLHVSNPWYGRITNDTSVETTALSGVPIESTVEIELIELLHGGPEDNYKPYLHLRGELTEAHTEVELPYGVTDLGLRRGAGLPVDAFYDFDQAQLVDLVSKGYFTDAFKVPEEMSGIPWTLPGAADFLVVAPALADEPPLVFWNVHNHTGLELDKANSGYTLASYFPDYSPVVEAQSSLQAAAAIDEPVHNGPAADLFSDVAFDAHIPDVEHASPLTTDDARSIVPDGVFARLVQEIEAKYAPVAEPVIEEVAREDGIEPGSAEDLYLSRVSPGVDQVLAGEHAEAAPADVAPDAEPVAPEQEPVEDTSELALTADGFLDLGEPAPELAPLSLQSEVSTEDHRRVAERAAALLRQELAGESSDAKNSDEQPTI